MTYLFHNPWLVNQTHTTIRYTWNKHWSERKLCHCYLSEHITLHWHTYHMVMSGSILESVKLFFELTNPFLFDCAGFKGLHCNRITIVGVVENSFSFWVVIQQDHLHMQVLSTIVHIHSIYNATVIIMHCCTATFPVDQVSNTSICPVSTCTYSGNKTMFTLAHGSGPNQWTNLGEVWINSGSLLLKLNHSLLNQHSIWIP